MSEPAESFGRRLVACRSASVVLDLLAAEPDRRADLAVLDEVTDTIIAAALRGERAVSFDGRWNDDTVSVPTLTAEARAAVEQRLDAAAMEAAGCWSVSQRETVPAGTITWAWWIREQPRFAGAGVSSDRRAFDPRTNPLATLVWANVAPPLALLSTPLELRTFKTGELDRAAQDKAWAQLDALLEFCDLAEALTDAYAPLRPGAGWADLTDDERVVARLTVVNALTALPDGTAARLRAHQIHSLAARIYAKARNGVMPTTRATLTKAWWRPMIGLFAGDWLGLLGFLGEHVNPAEEIISALPAPALFVDGAEHARAAAAEAGVADAEVDKMLAAFFGGDAPTSPVLDRVACLRDMWDAWDDVCARQTAQTGPLWGLFDEHRAPTEEPWDGGRPALHRALLPAELNARITSLWGTEATSKDPGRLVTARIPHRAAYEAAGDAMQFWHEVQLTAFKHVRTTGFYFDGVRDALRENNSERLARLTKAGCPVPTEFFVELAQAADALPEPERRQEIRRQEVAGGLLLETTATFGGDLPREGFEMLRDVVTRYRRAWAQEHLGTWLEQRWRTDLLAAHDAVSRKLAASGKSPPARQAMKLCQPALDRWFGGRLPDALTAIGQPATSAQPIHHRVLPLDPRAFADAVRRELGGESLPWLHEEWDAMSARQRSAYQVERDARHRRDSTVPTALELVRAWEIFDDPVPMKKVAGHALAARMLNPDDEEAGWAVLEAATRKVVAHPELMRSVDYGIVPLGPRVPTPPTPAKPPPPAPRRAPEERPRGALHISLGIATPEEQRIPEPERGGRLRRWLRRDRG